MTKPTIATLAAYIGKGERTLYHMKKVSPKQFDLLMAGWVKKCEELNNDQTTSLVNKHSKSI